MGLVYALMDSRATSAVRVCLLSSVGYVESGVEEREIALDTVDAKDSLQNVNASVDGKDLIAITRRVISAPPTMNAEEYCRVYV